MIALLPYVYALSFASHEGHILQTVTSSYDMQAILIERVFADISNGLVQYLSAGTPSGNICNWSKRGFKGGSVDYFEVACVSNKLQTFEMHNFREQGNYVYQYFPSSLEVLKIVNCDQYYELKTRLLPRAARVVSLAKNVLFGSIDMLHLPLHLEKFHLDVNYITEGICLAKLPETLKEFTIRRNKINQTTVYYENLPESLQQVDLRENSVRHVRPGPNDIPALGAKDRSQIFLGMNVR